MSTVVNLCFNLFYYESLNVITADEAVSQLKKGGVGMGSKTVPVKHRDMTRRSSDVGPMKRIPTKATMSRPDVSRSMSTAGQQSSSQPRSLARSRPQVNIFDGVDQLAGIITLGLLTLR